MLDNPENLLNKCMKIPVGFSKVLYKNEVYSIIRENFNNGNSIKIFAQSLKDTNYISTNIYITSEKILFKPCEMPMNKVTDFIRNFKFITAHVFY